ncbi:MAG: pyridoxamine 5'-phosphate oxidase family protein [Acidimicrobiia bacterium]
MAFAPEELNDEAIEFLTKPRVIAAFVTTKDASRPHAANVGYTYEHATRKVRIVTQPGSQKTLNVERGSRGILNQIDGMHWLQLEGPARVLDDPAAIADAYERFAARYGRVHDGATLVVIEIDVDQCRSPQNGWGRRQS